MENLPLVAPGETLVDIDLELAGDMRELGALDEYEDLTMRKKNV
jgi:hypothetical protein